MDLVNTKPLGLERLLAFNDDGSSWPAAGHRVRLSRALCTGLPAQVRGSATRVRSRRRDRCHQGFDQRGEAPLQGVLQKVYLHTDILHIHTSIHTYIHTCTYICERAAKSHSCALTELAWVYACARIKEDVEDMEKVDADNFAKNAADKAVVLKQKGCKATAAALVKLAGAMQSGDLAAVVRPCSATPPSAPANGLHSPQPHHFRVPFSPCL